MPDEEELFAFLTRVGGDEVTGAVEGVGFAYPFDGEAEFAEFGGVELADLSYAGDVECAAVDVDGVDEKLHGVRHMAIDVIYGLFFRGGELGVCGCGRREEGDAEQ